MQAYKFDVLMGYAFYEYHAHISCGIIGINLNASFMCLLLLLEAIAVY